MHAGRRHCCEGLRVAPSKPRAHSSASALHRNRSTSNIRRFLSLVLSSNSLAANLGPQSSNNCAEPSVHTLSTSFTVQCLSKNGVCSRQTHLHHCVLIRSHCQAWSAAHGASDRSPQCGDNGSRGAVAIRRMRNPAADRRILLIKDTAVAFSCLLSHIPISSCLSLPERHSLHSLPVTWPPFEAYIFLPGAVHLLHLPLHASAWLHTVVTPIPKATSRLRARFECACSVHEAEKKTP